MTRIYQIKIALLLITLHVVPNAVAQTVDVKYAAMLLWQAKQNNGLLPDIYRLNETVDDKTLYSIQKYYVASQLQNGASIGGFKGGFVPKAPVGGVLFGGKNILPSPAIVNINNFKLLVVEAEIGFRFCGKVTGILPSVSALKQVVCEVMPVIEVADGAIADFDTVKKDFKHLRATLISINVASSHTVVGQPIDNSEDLEHLAVKMRHNGEVIGTRDLAKPVDFWRNVLWVVNEFVVAQGYVIEPGHFIIPGNLTGIHVAERGAYVAEFGAHAKIALTVE